MKKIALSILLIFMIFQLSGCKTLFTEEGSLYSHSKPLVRRKQYDQALSNLSLALQIDPEYKKAILFLEKVYPEAITHYQREIRNLTSGEALSSLDRRAAAYRSLNSIAFSMGNLPGIIHPKTGTPLVFDVVNYDTELETAVLAAAEGYYQEGRRLAVEAGRESAKAASRAFKTALEYIPGYKDADSLEQDARIKAIQSIVFLPFRGDNYTYSGFNANEYLQNTIITDIVSNPSVMEYTNIVERALLEPVLEAQKMALTGLFNESVSIEIGKLVNANLIVAGKTNQISFDLPRVFTKSEHREKIITPTAEELGREPLESDAYSVEADIILYRKVAEVRVMASYKLIDIETGTLVLTDSLRKEESDSVYWAEYQGDERALTDRDRNLVDNKERSVKDVEDMLITALEAMGREISGQLGDYLR